MSLAHDQGFRKLLVSSLVLVGLLNVVQLVGAVLAAPNALLSRAPGSAASKKADSAALVPGRLPADGTGRIDQLTSIALPVASSATAEAAAARLTAAGFKADFANLYVQAAAATGTPWQLLAAVHWAETRQSGSTNRTSYAGATGPMQFLPATFARYGVDGDGNGRKDIHEVNDAVFSAGRYLAVNGAADGRYRAALLIYNHSNSYATSVLASAGKLGL